MAPRGRPPADHVFDAIERAWVHNETRRALDPKAHAVRVRAKKIACLRALYWERGGRQKRLLRYVRKRMSKPSQLTLDGASLGPRLTRRCREVAVKPPLR